MDFLERRRFQKERAGMGQPVYVSRMQIVRPAPLALTPVTATVANGRYAAGLALALWVICLAASSSLPARAQDEKPPANKTATEKPAAAEKPPADNKAALPPLPADAHMQQSAQIDGKTLHYTVTVGTLPVRDKEGKISG